MERAEDMLCGCQIPEEPKAAILFASIVPKEAVQPGYEPLVLPPAVDYLAPFKQWKKLGNDRYTDCVPATWANMRRLVTSKLTGREVYPSMDQVMDLYKTLTKTKTKTFDPKQGVAIQDALNYLIETPGPDGVRAIAFAKVDHTSINELRRALAIFGSVWVGLRVNEKNKDEFAYRQPWTPPPPMVQENNPVEGHSVLVGGYLENSNLKMVTWGETAQLTAEFAAEAAERIYEAWVVIWPEHLGSRRFMNGVNLTQLRSDYEKLTKRSMDSLDSLKPSLNRVHYILPHNPHKDPPSKFLEIHTIVPGTANGSQSATYNTPSVLAITPLSTNNFLKGTLLADNDDLYLIRKTETASDFVEVTRAFGPAYYELESETPIITAFKSKLASQGHFTIDNGDLYFIKTKGTSSGYIEVYFAPHEQLFQGIERYITGFKSSETADRYTVSGGDLYLITQWTRHPASLRIRCARGNANYLQKSITCQIIAAPFEMALGTLNIGTNGDLYMIQPADTKSKKVEVWIAHAQSNYAAFLPFKTNIEAQEGINVTGTTSKTTWIV